MTQPAWFFREFKPGDNVSDPEFTRALFGRDESAAARSLVREAVQNSLDARSAASSRVDVRFAIKTGSNAVPSGAAATFFDGLWPHVTSGDSGVQGPPDRYDAISCVVVEDFGTRGLTGNPTAWDPFDAGKNAFFLFFRALGRSGKEGEDRGRWGIGKFVFPMASLGHSFLALTISETVPEPLVMGRSVLRTHRVGASSYHPDGHWGLRMDNGLVVPVNDPGLTEELARVFGLRRVREPGLSVIVPWLQDDITAETIIAAAAGEYFLPVLRGELRIEVDHGGATTTIDAARLAEMADSMEPPLVRARVVLGLAAATWPQGDLMIVETASIDAEFDWTLARLTQEQRARASATLEKGEVLGLRVPTIVRRKDQEPARTYFDVFIHQVPGLGRTRPLIVREGIAVSEDKNGYLQDYASLVIIDHQPLATFVGDAETPAHNELQYDLVKAKYTLAGKLISFLRTAPSAIIREIEGGDQAPDTSLLAEYFPRPEPTPVPRKPRLVESEEGEDVPEVPDIPGRVPRFRIGKVRSGFTVTGTEAMLAGSIITIECAYDVRRGNPLRKYRSRDFVVGEDVSYATSGVALEAADANRIRGIVEESQFQVRVDGFDGHRNVYVRVAVDDGASEP